MKAFKIIAYHGFGHGAYMEYYGLVIAGSEEEAKEIFFKSSDGIGYDLVNDIDIVEIDITKSGVHGFYERC